MLRFIFSWILVFGCVHIWAQTPSTVLKAKTSKHHADRELTNDEQGMINTWEANSKVYVWADTAKVRSMPNLDASVADTLLAGDELTIIERLDTVSSKARGKEFNWFKISYQVANQAPRMGYMWGGLMSFKSLQKNNTKFVLGFNRIEERKDPSGDYLIVEKIVELKAVQNRQVVSKVQWAASLDLDIVEAHLYNNLGLQGVQQVLAVRFPPHACGVTGNTLYALWDDGQQLQGLPAITDWHDAGFASLTQSYHFPQDPQGLKQQILVKEVEERFFEKKEEYQVVRNKIIKTFAWDGKTLKQVSKKPIK